MGKPINPKGFRRHPDGIYRKIGNHLAIAADQFRLQGFIGHLVWPGKIHNWACYTVKLSRADGMRVEVIFYWMRKETHIKYLEPGERSTF